MAHGTEEPSKPRSAIIILGASDAADMLASDGLIARARVSFLLIYRRTEEVSFSVSSYGGALQKSGSLEHVAVRIFSRMTVSPELPKPLCISLHFSAICQSRL